MAVALSSSGGVAMRYVLLVLWVMFYGFMDARKPRQLNVAAQLIEAQPTRSFGLWLCCKRHVGIPVVDRWTRTHGPSFLCAAVLAN